MKLKVHVPVPLNLRTREDRIKARISTSGELLDTIKQRTERAKFGITDREIDQYYRFSDLGNTNTFFLERYKQFHDPEIPVDEQAILIDVQDSVNTFDFTRNRNRPSENFRDLAEYFADELMAVRNAGAPYVQIFRGPTGSGKTAYSKCLFSSGIWEFWSRGIVPTRVEFSKFFKSGKSVKIKKLLSSIHQCQIRDFLIYLFFSTSDPVPDDILEAIAPQRAEKPNRHELTSFNELTSDLVVDGESFTLSQAHALWKMHIKFYDPETCERILRLLKKPKFDVQFLVSLDGFDALKTKDFFQSESYHGPISAVADLLGASLNSAASYGETASSHNTNLMVYLRDTTYERIRLELHMGASGSRNLPVRWIVPPSYKTLVNTVARSIDLDVAEQVTSSKVAPFTENVRRSMVRVLKDKAIGLSVDQPLSSAFSWNARHMKRHIKRVCIWSLENYIHNHETEINSFPEDEPPSPSWLWDRAVRNPSLRNIYDYSVLEAFFLDDTRCLQSKMRLRSKAVQSDLNDERIESALNRLTERPELDGLFDSIVNYLTKGLERVGNDCVPHALVLVRILQLLALERGQTLDDLYDDISVLYPSLTQVELQFYLICLCENEYILFHGTENSASIEQCEFFISNFGSILLNKVFFSATYFSQTMMLAELPRFSLATEFKALDFRTSEHWLSHCIFNAIVGYNLISKIESSELGRIEDQEFSQLLRISDQLRISLVNEFGRVFSVRDRRPIILEYFFKIPEWLSHIKEQNPDFDEMEEVWAT